MSTMNDYSAAEWTVISAAPVATALAITLYDSVLSPRDAENTAGVARLVAGGLLDAPEVVRAVAERFSQGGGSELRALQNGNHLQSRDALIATIKKAVRAIEVRSPAEAEGFKAWLASVAAKVCHLASPSGGGTQVSHDRQDTIERLAEVLAVVFTARGVRPGKSSSPTGPHQILQNR
jgi:hypothetical protein